MSNFLIILSITAFLALGCSYTRYSPNSGFTRITILLSEDIEADIDGIGTIKYQKDADSGVTIINKFAP